MRCLPILCALAVLAACQKPAEPAANEAAAAAAASAVKGVHRERHGKPVPDVAFNNPDGGDISLADFRGVPVLINLWASWCAPCVKELPTLDALSRAHDTDGALGVIAVSQDTGPRASVAAFLKSHHIRSLAAYHDPDMNLSAELGADVLPTSILIDAEGREVWRYVGDLDWTGAEAARLLSEAGAPKSR